MKDGTVIHVERGYQIVEVLETLGGEATMRCVGFRLIGPRAHAEHVFTTEQQAKDALVDLCRPEADA